MTSLRSTTTILAIFATIFFATVNSQSNIGGDIASTIRIVAKLCLCSNRDPSVAQRFFDCYDVAPGKDLFVKCQLEVNGFTLNTQENVRRSCRTLYTFPSYASCLQREFAAAGIDLPSTLDAVNKCEAQVVGIN